MFDRRHWVFLVLLVGTQVVGQWAEHAGHMMLGHAMAGIALCLIALGIAVWIRNRWTVWAHSLHLNDYFADRKRKLDPIAFRKPLHRKGGEAPRPGDEID